MHNLFFETVMYPMYLTKLTYRSLNPGTFFPDRYIKWFKT